MVLSQKLYAEGIKRTFTFFFEYSHRIIGPDNQNLVFELILGVQV